MRNLAAEGKSIILITHKLEEIKAVAEKCTIIRRGKLIGVVDVAGTSVEEMAALMVGRPVSFKVDKGEPRIGEAVLEIRNLDVMNNKHVLGVKDFSLTIRRGEIVGIAGVDGNGQSELVEALSGLRKVEGGQIVFKGQDITNASIQERKHQLRHQGVLQAAVFEAWNPQPGGHRRVRAEDHRQVRRQERRGYNLPCGQAVRRKPAEGDHRPRGRGRP